ncbi:hypothetical protein Q3W71_17940 [Micromonospora sp. C28SCA-DRY-2]|uniref:hypothetical protein n=1 Tax=Micromonospora sp. C28SCA-DRY-2 TaxID=3059522 RepID=UPI002676F1D7|nr:hypothetical protein [Micromonospora sp. C28SCA-DRY-2]MDO3703553.1 hypothetical protein [Micromonospora sp. C28SCA-DRY-2]
MTTGWIESRAVLLAALRFFVRHYPVVFAFGVLASAQRFLAVGGGADWAWTGGIAGELFTNGIRLLFLLWVARSMLRPLRPTWSEVRHSTDYIAAHRAAMLWNGVLLVALTLVFKVGVDTWIAGLAEPKTALAWTLAVKNVTIIPFMFVWAVAVVRAALEERAGAGRDVAVAHAPAAGT